MTDTFQAGLLGASHVRCHRPVLDLRTDAWHWVIVLANQQVIDHAQGASQYRTLHGCARGWWVARVLVVMAVSCTYMASSPLWERTDSPRAAAESDQLAH
jgi:cytochrome c-type biogenesis protein CcmH/NrfG